MKRRKDETREEYALRSAEYALRRAKRADRLTNIAIALLIFRMLIKITLLFV